MSASLYAIGGVSLVVFITCCIGVMICELGFDRQCALTVASAIGGMSVFVALMLMLGYGAL